MVSNTTRLGQMGRRGFVSALTALGVSGEAAAALSSEELERLTGNPKRDVPRIKHYSHTNHAAVEAGEAAPKREPDYYTVPRDQWVRMETTLDATRRVGRRLSRLGLAGPETPIRVAMSNRTPELGVEVEWIDGTPTDVTTLREQLPASVPGSVSYDGKTKRRESIPVRVQSGERVEQSYFDKKYRPVPGGCEMNDGELQDKDGWTNATPAYDEVNNEQVWVTAGHTFGRNSGEAIWQSSDDGIVGYSTRALPDGEGDAGIIDAGVDATSATWYIASEVGSGDAYDWEIQGIAPNSRIQDMVANGEKSRFQGRRTGRSHSKLNRYFTPDWNGNSPTVDINHDSNGGDSGGAYYELDSDGAYMIGVHAWGQGSDALGNTMEYIENGLNIRV